MQLKISCLMKLEPVANVKLVSIRNKKDVKPVRFHYQDVLNVMLLELHVLNVMKQVIMFWMLINVSVKRVITQMESEVVNYAPQLSLDAKLVQMTEQVQFAKNVKQKNTLLKLILHVFVWPNITLTFKNVNYAVKLLTIAWLVKKALNVIHAKTHLLLTLRLKSVNALEIINK